MMHEQPPVFEHWFAARLLGGSKCQLVWWHTEKCPWSAAGLLSMAQLVDGPLPSLPAIAAASQTSEKRAFSYYPDCVRQDVSYFESAMRSFRSSLDAFPTPCCKPVEFLGTNRPGSADSEGGLGIYFSSVTKQCEEVLKQQGHTVYGYVPLARTGLLCQLASAAVAHAAEPAAADAAIAAAAAAAAAVVPGAAAAGTTSAASVAEPAVHIRRCSSSSSGDVWRGKPGLFLACIPEPSIQHPAQ